MVDKLPGLWHFTIAAWMDLDSSLPQTFKSSLKQAQLTSGYPSKCSSVYTACGETQDLWTSGWPPDLPLLGSPASHLAKPILLPFEQLPLSLCSPWP